MGKCGHGVKEGLEARCELGRQGERKSINYRAPPRELHTFSGRIKSIFIFPPIVHSAFIETQETVSSERSDPSSVFRLQDIIFYIVTLNP